MSTIEVNLEEFKRLAKEFVEAAPTANVDSLDAGFRCLTLAYFGLQDERPSDPIMAQSVFEWAQRKYEAHQRDLICGDIWDESVAQDATMTRQEEW